jgi:hypothetical protein
MLNVPVQANLGIAVESIRVLARYLICFTLLAFEFFYDAL